jgi:subtilisin-like proprotein convertase family protein
MKHVAPAVALMLAASCASAQPFCQAPNTPIPDNTAAGVQIPIGVALPAGSLVDSITVELEIDHAWVGDLVVSLSSPGGASVLLLDRPGIPSTGFPGPFGCGGLDVLAVFSDSASTPAESVCSLTGQPVITGLVSPADSLGSLVGAEASGTWVLTVSDGSSFDVGVVRSVCLNIAASQPCVADLAEPFGVLNFFDVSAFIGAYNAQDPVADLAAPLGVLNFFDVAEYIAQFNSGCP